MTVPTPDPKWSSVLKRRADRLAQERGDGAPRKVVYQVALVSVGSERFGIPARRLRTIVPPPPIAPLRGLPPWMLGLAHIRTDLICVVSLAGWFGIQGAQDPNSLAVVEGPRGLLGLLADRTLGFGDVHQDELVEDADANARSERPVCALTRDLVAILDLDRFLADPKLIVHHS